MEAELDNPGKGKMNRLAGSGSPYLLQHAANPVDWHPWSEEAFQLAKDTDRPVFLSIGYSTCHWCHVMERESFSDPEVAGLMNETFVCVKVDREERPDIDHRYMTVCQLLTGSGGWPLTIIMTPWKKPFFAGTYFPRGERYGRQGMLQIIPRIRELWSEERDSVNSSADEIVEGLETFMAPDAAAAPSLDMPARAYRSLKEQYDSRHGGFGSAPKFPVFSNLLFLLAHWHRTGEEQALSMVRNTLGSMRKGGIFDQIGYGLHRYSTDERWLAPHFEKMLYDQALAVLTCSDAFRPTGEDRFRKMAEEIITYVLRDLVSPEGSFYSAEDADSEGEEGKFYTWTVGELGTVLDSDTMRFVREVYNVTDAGNFLNETGEPGGRNILYLDSESKDLSGRTEMSPGEIDGALKHVREKLMAARANRVRPLRDDKVMTDWNGLMIAALARAAAAFQEVSYAEAAGKALEHILTSRAPGNGHLLHIRYNGGEEVPAFLDDYAYLLWGVLEMHQFTHRGDLIITAKKLAEEMVDLFEDRENGGFFLTAGQSESSSSRLKPSFDGPIPSGNSVAAMSLLRLGRLLGQPDLEEQGHRTIRAFASEMALNPAGFTHMVSALEMAQEGTAEVIIAGDPEARDTRELVTALQRSCPPGVTSVLIDPRDPDPDLLKLIPYASGINTVQGKAAAYICRDSACQAPVTDPGDLLKALSGKGPSGS